MKISRRLGIGSVLGVAICVAAYFASSDRLESNGVSLRMSKLERGNLLVTISATGTLEPEEVVDVGAQVAGQIDSFGKDNEGREIDYGSTVEEGMVLATIDDSLYQADVVQSRAELQRAKATLLQSQAKFVQAERDWVRAQKPEMTKALSESSIDAFKAAYLAAQADVAVAEGDIARAEAGLVKSERNLRYCTIVSPVKGVIIDRRVNIGQTVVASLNAPSLFLMAKDLRHMEVWVAVNEADIGSIYAGQPVSFTVDAFPGLNFDGKVRKIRLNASMSQNVVTYIVEVETDNKEGKLLPYLSASVKFEVTRQDNALLVPNAALRWTPSPELSKKLEIEKITDKQAVQAKGETNTAKQGTVWVKNKRGLKPVSVSMTGSDGVVTGIEAKDLKEGDEVIIGEETVAASSDASQSNPFAPKLTRSKRN